MTSSICEIEKLVDLFSFGNSENQLEDDQDDETPEDNNTQCSSSEQKKNTEKAPKKKKQSPYDIIEPTTRREILDPDGDNIEELYFDEASPNAGQKNWKKTPNWDISYRQSVTASDVFLGMGFKNPSTASCENMIVTVELPGENRQNIDLKIEKKNLIINSPKFLLELDLPHPVDPKRGNAQFDKEGEKLIVTLIMDREYDLINF